LFLQRDPQEESNPYLQKQSHRQVLSIDADAVELTRVDALALSDTTATSTASQVSDNDTDVLFFLVQLLGHRAQNRHVRQPMETVL